MNNPTLRFREYAEDFKCSALGNKCSIFDGTHATPNYVDSGVPFYSVEQVTSDNFRETKFISEEVFEKESRRVILEKGDVLMTRIGDVGTSRLIDWDVKASFYVSLALIKPKRDLVGEYIAQYIKSPYFQGELYKRMIHVAFPKKINLGEIGKCNIRFPELQEQKRIAGFLSAVDEKIRLLKEKHALLQKYKKGLMQKLFSQEIRFKDDNDQAFPDWTEKRFEKCFERVTRKNKIDNRNVLTISAQHGLINQEKYFNKSVSAADVTGYYLLNKGEFAYNKSYSKGYPMGAIKRLNNYDQGVVSTLYICFKSINNQFDTFWEQFFEGGMLNREISKIAQEGARNHGLLNVSVTEFFHDMKVTVPCIDEQKKIAEFLQTLDKKLDAVQQQIDLTQTFKKGLLQQMFV